MKPIFAVIFSVVAASAALSAQIEVSKGIKAGINFTTFAGSQFSSTNSTITQYLFGAFAEVKFLDKISLEPEVFYDIKGAKVTIKGGPMFLGGNGYAENDHFGYLEVPLLIKYYLPFSPAKLSVYAGPSVGFLLNAKAKSVLAGGDDSEIDIMSQTASPDYGVVIGTGLNVPTGLIDATVDVRYDLGLKTVTTNGSHIYNRMLAVLVGVSL